MKSSNVASVLLTSLAMVSAASVPSQPRDVADGFYQVTTDAAGNTHTEFTAYDFSKAGPASKEARSLDKRREACGPGSASVGEADQANACLIDSFGGDNVYLNKNSWSYCVRGNVVSFICPYSNGYKPKNSVKGTWSYVKGRCGLNKVGYAQVSDGSGDWTAGYALKSDNFCTSTFKVGS